MNYLSTITMNGLARSLVFVTLLFQDNAATACTNWTSSNIAAAGLLNQITGVEKRGGYQESEQDSAKQPETRQDEKPVTADTTDWLIQKLPDAGAEFKMPVKPQLLERIFSPVEGLPPIKLRNYLVEFNQGMGLFLFSYHDLHQVPADTAIDETLKEAMLQSLSNIQGRLMSEPKKIRYRTNPGWAYEFRFANKDRLFRGSARIFLVGNRQYQIAAMMEEGSVSNETMNAYLNSLRLLEPKPTGLATEDENKKSTEVDAADDGAKKDTGPEKSSETLDDGSKDDGSSS